MSRRYKKLPRRKTYHECTNYTIIKLTNFIMKNGKKQLAKQIIFDCLWYLRKVTNFNPIKLLNEAISNIVPYIEVRNKKVGGVNYQVPVDTSSERRTSLCLKWLIKYAKRRKEHGMALKVAHEIIDSILNKSESYKHKLHIYKLVKTNQAFSHLGW